MSVLIDAMRAIEQMDKRLFFMMTLAQGRLYKYADKHCEAELAVSVAQSAALFYVLANEGCLLRELAATLGLNNSAITGLSNRMEKNGLVEKRACEHDGRASRIFLTDLGRQKLKASKPLLKRLNDEISEGFSDEELDTITRFLNKMAQRF